MPFFHPVTGEHLSNYTFRRKADQEPKAKAEASACIKNALALEAQVDNLSFISKQEDALAALRAAGIKITDYEFAETYDRHSDDNTRRSTQTRIVDQIHDRFARETEVIARRIASSVIEEMRADFETMKQINDRWGDRVGVRSDVSEITGAMAEITERMQRHLTEPHLARPAGGERPSPYITVARWFTAPIDVASLAAK